MRILGESRFEIHVLLLMIIVGESRFKIQVLLLIGSSCKWNSDVKFLISSQTLFAPVCASCRPNLSTLTAV
jgi:hypothetical protein